MLILCSIFVRYPLKGVQTLTGLKSLKTIKHGQHGSRNTLQTLDVGRYFRISKQELKACSFGFVSLQLYIYTSSFSISRYFEAIFVLLESSLCEPAKSWKDEQRLRRCQTRKALRYLPLSFLLDSRWWVSDFTTTIRCHRCKVAFLSTYLVHFVKINNVSNFWLIVVGPQVCSVIKISLLSLLEIPVFCCVIADRINQSSFELPIMNVLLRCRGNAAL